MAHHNTVLSQLLKFIPRHEFERLANAFHEGRQARKMTRWAQFIAMSVAQLTGRCSLRDVAATMTAQVNKLYHLGTTRVTRSSLARVNEQKTYHVFEALFGKLLTRCQAYAPKHGFRFTHKLYSLDASTIDLCLSVFPWAKFRRTKGAIRLHVGLDHSGYLPTFVRVTDGKTHDVTIGRTLTLPKHSIVVFDRGYTDYQWYNLLNQKDIFFVTRQKTNATYTVTDRRKVNKNQGIRCDQTIKIKGIKAKVCPIPLRRIGYTDPETGKRYTFLTNNFSLSAKTIADIYKARWQIEIFFKMVKQNLKIKTFLGTSKNAVLTQVWVALCMHLLIAYIKFCCRIDLSFQQIIRLLQLNLFERRDLTALLKGPPPDPETCNTQLSLQLSRS